jgi:hypothetical protein
MIFLPLIFPSLATAVSGIYTRHSLLNEECWEGVEP